MPAPTDRHRTLDEYQVEDLILELFLAEYPHTELRCSECGETDYCGKLTPLMVYNDSRLVCYNCERTLDWERRN